MLDQVGYATIEQMRVMIGVSEQTIRNALDVLLRKKEIEQTLYSRKKGSRAFRLSAHGKKWPDNERIQRYLMCTSFYVWWKRWVEQDTGYIAFNPHTYIYILASMLERSDHVRWLLLPLDRDLSYKEQVHARKEFDKLAEESSWPTGLIMITTAESYALNCYPSFRDLSVNVALYHKFSISKRGQSPFLPRNRLQQLLQVTP